MLKWLKTAFAAPRPEGSLPDAHQGRLIDRLAAAIVRRRLSSPALILLECGRPLNFVASQFLLFAAPLAEVIFPRDDYRAVVAYLQRRGSVEHMCRRIEELEAAMRDGR